MEITNVTYEWLGEVPILEELKELTSCLLYSSCNQGGIRLDDKGEWVPSTKNPHLKQDKYFTYYRDYTFINKTNNKKIKLIGLAESDPHDKQDDEFFVSKYGLYRNACDVHLDKNGLFPYRRKCTSVDPKYHRITVVPTTYAEIIKYCREDLEKRLEKIKETNDNTIAVELMNNSYCKHLHSQLGNGRWSIEAGMESYISGYAKYPKIPLPLLG